jgi:hypothetical protein
MNTTLGLIVHIAITIAACTGIFLTQRNRYQFCCAGLILVFFGLFILLTGKYPGTFNLIHYWIQQNNCRVFYRDLWRCDVPS